MSKDLQGYYTNTFTKVKKPKEHYPYYFRGYKIDPYRIAKIYQITEPPLYHAIKKILRAGKGKKSKIEDIEEAIVSLERYLEIEKEDMEHSKEEIIKDAQYLKSYMEEQNE